MISIRVVLDPSGVASAVEALGHASGKARGENVACGAVTVLVRTAYEAFAAEPGIELAASAPGPGELRFAVKRYGVSARDAARAISGFLTIGLSGVQREYPGAVHLTIETA
ncbi:MAG: ribosomal-processing cysteine protease Prp [Spirochaetes bacterium]|nr:ribosomal-processing cysteine protease Prp [Spirochaetota bacterium]